MRGAALAPCVPDELVVGAIVLVRIDGNDYVRRVTAIDGQRFQVGNNRGHVNRWGGLAAICGRATEVERG